MADGIRDELDEIWIQPAAGDAGGALGVAFSLWHRYLDKPRVSPEAAGAWVRPGRSGRPGAPARYADGMNGSLLGPRFTPDEIRRFIDGRGAVASQVAPAALADTIAALLADEKVIGLFQGRMEFGPRALGARSILGDAVGSGSAGHGRPPVAAQASGILVETVGV